MLFSGTTFFVVFFGLLALVAVLFGLTVAQRRRVRQRPTVNGTVVAAEIRTVQINDDASSRGPGDTYFTPLIRFRYEVAGKQYECSKRTYHEDDGGAHSVVPGVHFVREEHARRVLDRYPPGSSVLVHYDPQNPADAVLEV